MYTYHNAETAKREKDDSVPRRPVRTVPAEAAAIALERIVAVC